MAKTEAQIRKAKEQARIAHRRKQAFAYHLAGKSDREIAEILDVDHTTIGRDLKASYAAQSVEDDEAIIRERTKLVAQLNVAINAMVDQIQNVPVTRLYNEEGEPRRDENGEPLTMPIYKLQHSAAQQLSSLADRKAKLTGLNKPEKKDVNAQVSGSFTLEILEEIAADDDEDSDDDLEGDGASSTG